MTTPRTQYVFLFIFIVKYCTIAIRTRYKYDGVKYCDNCLESMLQKSEIVFEFVLPLKTK